MLLNSDKYFKSQKILDMFKVSQLDVPDMTVHVNSGTIIYNNQVINFSEQDSEYIEAPRIGTWLVVISINTKGQLVYTYGVQSTEDKQIPVLPEDCFHLCIIEVGADTMQITNDMISDMRNMYHFSSTQEQKCVYKCGLESDYSFTEEDRKMLKSFYDKYEDLQAQIDNLKLLFNPKKEYTVLTDSGLEYKVRFKDDGTPYFSRNDAFDDIDDNPEEKHKNYKFTYNNEKITVVMENPEQYLQLPVKIKSFDNLNDALNVTLFVRCKDATIYSPNFEPHYQEDEFQIKNLDLTKSGFFEKFSVKFHGSGNHDVQLLLYDSETKQLMDKASISYAVEFTDEDSEEIGEETYSKSSSKSSGKIHF